MKTPSKSRTEAQRLTTKLMDWGLKYEEIAFKLKVSLNSIIRWRRGVNPQPGHLKDLQALVTSEQKKHVKQSA